MVLKPGARRESREKRYRVSETRASVAAYLNAEGWRDESFEEQNRGVRVTNPNAEPGTRDPAPAASEYLIWYAATLACRHPGPVIPWPCDRCLAWARAGLAAMFAARPRADTGPVTPYPEVAECSPLKKAGKSSSVETTGSGSPASDSLATPATRKGRKRGTGIAKS